MNRARTLLLRKTRFTMTIFLLIGFIGLYAFPIDALAKNKKMVDVYLVESSSNPMFGYEYDDYLFKYDENGFLKELASAIHLSLPGDESPSYMINRYFYDKQHRVTQCWDKGSLITCEYDKKGRPFKMKWFHPNDINQSDDISTYTKLVGEMTLSYNNENRVIKSIEKDYIGFYREITKKYSYDDTGDGIVFYTSNWDDTKKKYIKSNWGEQIDEDGKCMPYDEIHPSKPKYDKHENMLTYRFWSSVLVGGATITDGGYQLSNRYKYKKKVTVQQPLCKDKHRVA